MLKIASWTSSFCRLAARCAGEKVIIFVCRGIGLVVGSLAVLPVAAQTIVPTNLIFTTGISSSVTIAGPGYFVLEDPVTHSGFVTRYGNFTLDSVGYLVNNWGMRVQGYSDAELTQTGNIKVDTTGSLSTAEMACYAIQSDGKMRITLADGTSFVRAQILLQKFLAPAKLGLLPYGTFSFSAAAVPLPQPLPPGAGGLGGLLTGQLELPVPTLTMSRVPTAPPPATTQGILTGTAIATDLALLGPGFFIVRDTNSSVCYATRAGAFYLDGNGYLINYSGLRLQGYSNSDLNVIGDLQINTNTDQPFDPSQGMTSFAIDWSGMITIALSDGTEFTRGQILLQNCSHPELLVKTNFGLYAMTTAAGPWTRFTAPISTNFSWVLEGNAELNQFDQNILNVRQRLNFFEQGALNITTNPTDLAISGNGFFTVRDADQNIFYATRNGAFHLDTCARLIDGNGFRVQGLNSAALTTVGDLAIDATGITNFGVNLTMIGFYIDPMGEIQIELSDGSQFTRGQILLQNFRDLQALMPLANQLYSNLTAAAPIYTIGLPNRQGLGNIQPNALEAPVTPATLQLPLQTGYRLYVSGLYAGATMQGSSDLHAWTDLGHVAASVLWDAEFFDTNAPAFSQRFYRVKLN